MTATMGAGEATGTARTLAMPEPPRQLVPAPNGCGGWRDEEGRWHTCATTGEKIYAQARCLRCYNRQRRVVREGERRAREGAPLLAPAPAPARTLAWTPAASAQDAQDAQDAAPGEGFAWEVFRGGPPRRGGRGPRASVYRGRALRLNKAALALWGREVAAVEVLFDRARGAVALRPCDPALPHARLLTSDRGGRSLAVGSLRAATGMFAGGASTAATPRLVGDLMVLEFGAGAA